MVRRWCFSLLGWSPQSVAALVFTVLGLSLAGTTQSGHESSPHAPGDVAAGAIGAAPASAKPSPLPNNAHATVVASGSSFDNLDNSSRAPTVLHPTAFGTSPPLRELAGISQTKWSGLTLRHSLLSLPKQSTQGRIVDRVEQSTYNPPLSNYSIGASFQGLGNGFPSFTVANAVPDANIAVGDSQIVEWVNSSYVICSKTSPFTCGNVILGNALWAAGIPGTLCANNNDGQPIVQWDVQAHRWLLFQNVFVFPYAVCVAVSDTNDATGTYSLYQYPVSNNGFPDYPKWGVWSTGYFQTWNNFGPNGDSFQGSVLCAYNRAKMLVGDATAEQICHQYTVEDFSLLPADIDSPTSPPIAQDEFAIGSLGIVDTSHLSVYSAHINNLNDWTQGATFTGDNNSQLIAITPFTSSCDGALGGNCVPQKGVAEDLSSLGDRLMYRFVYYNDAPGGQSAIPATRLTLVQDGTYAPDGNWRWMGSIARDKSGDLLLGYSESCGDNCPGGTPTFPSIFVAGRTSSDPLGTLEPELMVIAGTGSQTASPWGSYNSMRIDPSDVCTFWYTNEYYTPTTTLDWSTQLASIRFSGCNFQSSPPLQHWYVNFDVTASSGQTGVRWMELTGGLPTGTNVISSPDPSTYYQPVLITAFVFSLQPGGGIPTGTVDFTDTFNNTVTPLCTGVTLNSQGFAFCTTPILVVGAHDQILATYNGDSNFAGSSGTDDSQVVNQATTVTTVSSAPNPSQFNEPVAITAVVTGQFGGIPTGTVSFTDNGTLLCSGISLDNTGTAICRTQSLAVGSHSLIVASYSGDANFLASSATDPPQVVIKAGTSTQVTSTPNPSQFNQSVTITAVVAGNFGGGPPTGSVSFTSDNNPICSAVQLGNGGVATCLASNLPAGSHNVQACYSGDSNFQPGCGQETQVVKQAASAVTVTSAPNPSQFGQPAVVTAAVSGVPGGGLPTGTVTFTDTFNGIQTTLCSGVQLNELGAARCSTSTLACGTHSQLVASYSSDQNYLPGNGTDSPPQVVVGCGDFTVLPISPGAVQVTQTFTNNDDPFFPQAINVTVQPLNGYSSTVQLSCSVSPPLSGGSCAVNPPTSGSLATGNLSTTLTISVGGNTPTGNYTVTVLAQDDSGLMHTATLALTVDEKTTGLTMTTGGTGPPVPVVFGPGPGVVNNPSCTLVSGTGIAGTEDFGLIGGVCSFNPTTTNLPDPVVVTISGCTIAQLRAGTRFYASLWFGLPGIVLLGSFRKRPRAAKKLLRIFALFLAVSILLIAMGCGGVGQTTPTGSYLVLVQGTGADGTVYSAVIPVTVKPLGQ